MTPLKGSGPTDIVLIHTYKRVRFLYPQVLSFIKNQDQCNCECEKHQVQIIVVDDSADAAIENAFMKEVDRVSKEIRRLKLPVAWEIDYWSKDRQTWLIDSIGGDQSDVIFRDSESGKLGGVRTIQNISLLIAEHVSGQKDQPASGVKTLVHRLDDDVFAYSLTYQDNDYSIKPIHNFLCKKRHSLSRPGVRISGSYYTLDGPSPITDLFEVVEAIYCIFSNITRHEITKQTFPWSTIEKHLYVYGVPAHIDDTGVDNEVKELLNLSHLAKTEKLDVLFSQVIYALELFNVGVNRFEYNLDCYAQERNWSQQRSMLPGGCISFRLDENTIPNPNFGDQDLLWSYFEHLRGGVYGDFSILHVKTGLIRRGFIDTVIRGQETEVRCTFPVTVKCQELISRRLGQHLENQELLDFGGFGPEIVNLTRKRLHAIFDKVDTLITNNPHVSKALKSQASAIQNHLSPILDNYDLITNRYELMQTATAEAELSRQCDKWIESEKQWLKLRQHARTAKPTILPVS